MGNPYRTAGLGSNEPLRGPFDPGPLVTPHYVLTLRRGAAMLSVEHAGVWVTRLEYDPVRMTARTDADGEPVYEIDDPELTALHTPLVAAFGEIDESRESVEAAFLDALCGFWCSIVRHFTEGAPVSDYRTGDIDESEALEYPDIWGGNQDDIERDLLFLVEGASPLNASRSSHRACYPSLATQRSFWRKHKRGYMYDDIELLGADVYFREAIRVWQRSAQESPRRVRTPF